MAKDLCLRSQCIPTNQLTFLLIQREVVGEKYLLCDAICYSASLGFCWVFVDLILISNMFSLIAQ